MSAYKLVNGILMSVHTSTTHRVGTFWYVAVPIVLIVAGAILLKVLGG